MAIPYKSSYYLLLASILAFGFWFITENTYDLGDSITHYAIAHYSWKHPYLLFDNWGKPFFTIIASPFAQFGWKGITFFNTLIGLATSFIIAEFIVLKKWNISPYIALLLFFIPNYPLSLNSGLTEPLYALILITSIFLFESKRWLISMILLSFLPFVRSEGFITTTVFALYYLMHKNYKYLPLLFIGTISISILGFIITYDHLDWMFTKNPYIENVGHNYGSGNWFDYFSKMYYMCGIPFTVLFWMASIYMLYQLILKCKQSIWQFFQAEESLYLQVFFTYFFAHVIFWKFGIFNSFGMSRVLIAILPVGFLFIVYFLNDLNNHIKNSKYIIYPIIIITLLFPFTKNKSAWSKADFKQDETITKLEALKPKINNLISDKTTVLYTSYPILTLLDYDVYDTIQFKLFTNKNYHTFEKDTNCIMILDTWTTQYDYNANDALLKVNSKSLIIKENISENNDLKVYINK